MPTLAGLLGDDPSTVGGGLLGYLTSFIDNRKRALGTNLANLGLLGTQINESARDFNRDNRQWAGAEQSVIPELRDAAHQRTMNQAMNVGGLLGMTAWHGSPHKFDKFDMSKIGTGEGAQAYGHGLYFAEQKGVAKSYQDALTDMYPNGVVPKPGSAADRAAAYVASEIDSQAQYPFITAIQKAQRFLEDDPQKQDIINQIREWHRSGTEFKRAGALYKVDIPDEAVGKMLDWDKPLSQQPESVRKALQNVDLSTINRQTAKMIQSGQADGHTIYNAFGAYKDPAGAAAKLRALGVPGIKYKDGGSRGGEGGTHNFVLFDDQLPKIIGRE